MKRNIRLIPVILAAGMLLASCTQGFLDEQGRNPQSEGPRTIAVSFGPQTRTALGEDGVTPKFENGDEIMVANGHAAKVCSVSVDGKGNASFTTDLTGTLMAIYPAEAAVVENDVIANYKVSTEQTGLFKDANIATVLSIPEDAKSVEFMNITAVFEITLPENSTYLEVISSSKIASFVPEGSVYDTRQKIHIDLPETNRPEKYYVSVCPGEFQVKNISFANGKSIKTIMNTDQILLGRLYKVDENGWNTEYADIPMTVNGVTRNYKWATMNIGASAPEEAGDYFAWGAPEVAYSSLTEGSFTFKNAAPESYTFGAGDDEGKNWDASAGFSWVNTPFNGGAMEYNDEAFNNCASDYEDKTLVLTKDAAQCNWSGSWRMPTMEEFDALKEALHWVWDSTDNGMYAYRTQADDIDKSNALLFFPAAGKGNGLTLYTDDDGLFGEYWSSTLYNNPAAACALGIASGGVAIRNPDRNFGCSIRAISE